MAAANADSLPYIRGNVCDGTPMPTGSVGRRRHTRGSAFADQHHPRSVRNAQRRRRPDPPEHNRASHSRCLLRGGVASIVLMTGDMTNATNNERSSRSELPSHPAVKPSKTKTLTQTAGTMARRLVIELTASSERRSAPKAGAGAFCRRCSHGMETQRSIIRSIANRNRRRPRSARRRSRNSCSMGAAYSSRKRAG